MEEKPRTSVVMADIAPSTSSQTRGRCAPLHYSWLIVSANRWSVRSRTMTVDLASRYCVSPGHCINTRPNLKADTRLVVIAVVIFMTHLHSKHSKRTGDG